jgi:hypothetical protein
LADFAAKSRPAIGLDVFLNWIVGVTGFELSRKNVRLPVCQLNVRSTAFLNSCWKSKCDIAYDTAELARRVVPVDSCAHYDLFAYRRYLVKFDHRREERIDILFDWRSSA